MRKFLIPLLMAGVVMPATAYARPDNNESRHERSSEHRSERSSAERPQRTEHVQRAERPVKAERSSRAVRIEQRQARPVQQEVRQVRRTDRGPAEAIRRVNRDQQTRTVVRRHTATDGRAARPHVRSPALVEQLAPRQSLRLAQLSQQSPVAVPARPLLRPLRLGLSPPLDRAQYRFELLRVELLARRSLDVSPAAGLRSVSVGPLL